MTLADLAARLAEHRLAVFGGFHPQPDDDLPDWAQTVVMIGPAEPGYWAHLTTQPEWQDGTPDPVDRWSRRVLGTMACDLGGKAYFPFGGPPYHPFYRWALRTGQAWDSPVRLLVQADAGLMVSYRGALVLRDRLALPAPVPRPCDTCAQPCRIACPAEALTDAGYDLPACHDWLNTPQGASCMSGGCRVRLSCPISQTYGRLPEHSAYHMRIFHK